MKTFKQIAWVGALCLLVAVGTAYAQAGGALAGSIAQSQEDQLKAVTHPLPLPVRSQQILRLPEKPAVEAGMATAASQSGEIITVVLDGDMAWLGEVRVADEKGKKRTLAAQISKMVAESQGDRARLEQGVKQIQQMAVAAGYFFATFHLDVPGGKKAGKTATLRVDSGYVGERNVFFQKTSGEEVNRPTGRYFSKEQIERRFSSVEPGKSFSYSLLHHDFQMANQHPDLLVSPHLRLLPAPDAQEGDPRRNVGVDLNVEERLPLHAALGIDNYGTDLTDNWTARLTVQHLNLTKADDVLTVNLQAALDWGSLYGVAASYYRPFELLCGGGWSVFGGYSDVESKDVLPELDVKGYGTFGGVHGTLNLLDTDRRKISAGLGMMYRYVEDKLVFDGEKLPLGDVTLIPFSASLSYADKQPDFLHGFNFATVEGIANIGDFLGSSDDMEMQTQRNVAEADYLIFRAQAARLQRLWGEPGVRQWMLFLKGSAQVADGPLIPAEQMGLGGADDVRGYTAREFLGDNAVAGTVELRTPMLPGPFAFFADRHDTRWKSRHDRFPVDRVQLVCFADIGYFSLKDAMPNELDNETIYSAGLGVRYALAENLQIKFDWGFPLKETDASDHGGAGYLNVQFLF